MPNIPRSVPPAAFTDHPGDRTSVGEQPLAARRRPGVPLPTLPPGRREAAAATRASAAAPPFDGFPLDPNRYDTNAGDWGPLTGPGWTHEQLKNSAGRLLDHWVGGSGNAGLRAQWMHLLRQEFEGLGETSRRAGRRTGVEVLFRLLSDVKKEDASQQQGDARERPSSGVARGVAAILRAGAENPRLRNDFYNMALVGVDNCRTNSTAQFAKIRDMADYSAASTARDYMEIARRIAADELVNDFVMDTCRGTWREVEALEFATRAKVVLSQPGAHGEALPLGHVMEGNIRNPADGLDARQLAGAARYVRAHLGERVTKLLAGTEDWNAHLDDAFPLCLGDYAARLGDCMEAMLESDMSDSSKNARALSFKNLAKTLNWKARAAATRVVVEAYKAHTSGALESRESLVGLERIGPQVESRVQDLHHSIDALAAAWNQSTALLAGGGSRAGWGELPPGLQEGEDPAPMRTHLYARHGLTLELVSKIAGFDAVPATEKEAHLAAVHEALERFQAMRPGISMDRHAFLRDRDAASLSYRVLPMRANRDVGDEEDEDMRRAMEASLQDVRSASLEDPEQPGSVTRALLARYPVDDQRVIADSLRDPGPGAIAGPSARAVPGANFDNDLAAAIALSLADVPSSTASRAVAAPADAAAPLTRALRTLGFQENGLRAGPVLPVALDTAVDFLGRGIDPMVSAGISSERVARFLKSGFLTRLSEGLGAGDARQRADGANLAAAHLDMLRLAVKTGALGLTDVLRSMRAALPDIPSGDYLLELFHALGRPAADPELQRAQENLANATAFFLRRAVMGPGESGSPPIEQERNRSALRSALGAARSSAGRVQPSAIQHISAGGANSAAQLANFQLASWNLLAHGSNGFSALDAAGQAAASEVARATALGHPRPTSIGAIQDTLAQLIIGGADEMARDRLNRADTAALQAGDGGRPRRRDHDRDGAGGPGGAGGPDGSNASRAARPIAGGAGAAGGGSQAAGGGGVSGNRLAADSPPLALALGPVDALCRLGVRLRQEASRDAFADLTPEDHELLLRGAFIHDRIGDPSRRIQWRAEHLKLITALQLPPRQTFETLLPSLSSIIASEIYSPVPLHVGAGMGAAHGERENLRKAVAALIADLERRWPEGGATIDKALRKGGFHATLRSVDAKAFEKELKAQIAGAAPGASTGPIAAREASERMSAAALALMDSEYARQRASIARLPQAQAERSTPASYTPKPRASRSGFLASMMSLVTSPPGTAQAMHADSPRSWRHEATAEARQLQGEQRVVRASDADFFASIGKNLQAPSWKAPATEERATAPAQTASRSADRFKMLA